MEGTLVEEEEPHEVMEAVDEIKLDAPEEVTEEITEE